MIHKLKQVLGWLWELIKFGGQIVFASAGSLLALFVLTLLIKVCWIVIKLAWNVF